MFGSRWHVMTSREATLACRSKADKTETSMLRLGKHPVTHCTHKSTAGYQVDQGPSKIHLSSWATGLGHGNRLLSESTLRKQLVCVTDCLGLLGVGAWHQPAATVPSAPDGGVAKEQLSADMPRDCVAGDDPVMCQWVIFWVELRQHSHRGHCDPVLVTRWVTGR